MLIDDVRSIPPSGPLLMLPDVAHMVFHSKVVRVPAGQVPSRLPQIFGPQGPEAFVLPCSPIIVEDDEGCVILQNYDNRVAAEMQPGLRVMRLWAQLYRLKPGQLRQLLEEFPCFRGCREDSVAFELGLCRGVEYIPTDDGPSRSGDGMMSAFALVDPGKGWVMAPPDQAASWMQKIGHQQAVTSVCTAIEQIAFFKLKPE